MTTSLGNFDRSTVRRLTLVAMYHDLARCQSCQRSARFLITPRFEACNKTCEYTTWNFTRSRNKDARARVAVRVPILDATAEPNCSKVFPSSMGTTLNQD